MTATTPTDPFPTGITVDIEESDGTRCIVVWGHDCGDQLTSAQARQLAATLLESAAEIDGWTR